MRCIICGKEKEPSKEHIIPQALGNEKLVSFNVCENCNNLLGTRVDDYFVNHAITKIIRQNVFNDKNIKIMPGVMEGSDGRKYDITKNGYKIHPEFIRNQDGSATIIASTVEEGKKLAIKKLKRFKLSDEQITDIMSKAVIGEKKQSKPIFNLPADIDTGKLCLSIAKIAYELSYEEIGSSYYDDPIAEKMRNALFSAIQQDSVDYDELRNLVLPVDPEMNKEIQEMASIEPSWNPLHLVAFWRQGRVLGCIIYLFLNMGMSFNAILSKNAANYSVKHEIIIVQKDGNIIYF